MNFIMIPVQMQLFVQKLSIVGATEKLRLHGGEKEKLNQDDAYSLARAILLIGGIVAIAFGATALGNDITSYRTISSAFAKASAHSSAS